MHNLVYDPIKRRRMKLTQYLNKSVNCSILIPEAHFSNSFHQPLNEKAVITKHHSAELFSRVGSIEGFAVILN